MTKERELLARAGLIIAQYRWSDPEDQGLQKLAQQINAYFEEPELESRPIAYWDTQNGTLIPAVPLSSKRTCFEAPLVPLYLHPAPEPMQDEPADISAKSGLTIAAMLPNGVAVPNVYEAYEAGLKEGNLQYENPVATLDHSGRFVLLKMVGIPISQPMKLYEHPAPRQFVRLTDEEILEIVGPYSDAVCGYTRKLFDAIQDKLEEKNK